LANSLGVLILAALYLISLQGFLLFHCFVEIFSMVIAFGIFLVAWNSRQFRKTDYLLFVGIADLFNRKVRLPLAGAVFSLPAHNGEEA
jgi:hypothetical protein